MVNYGFDSSSNISGLIKNDHDFLHFRKIHSIVHYDFVTTLSFNEFIDFHKKYHNQDFDPNSETLEEFKNGVH